MYRWPADILLFWMLRGVAVLVASIALLIGVFLVMESLPALRSAGLGRFFTDPSWHPSGGAEQGQFNLTPMLLGTLAATAGALLLATPLGIASAVFCRFYAPPLIGSLYRRMIGVLAGIPSVVYGFWGLVVLAPLIRQWQPPGQSLLAAVLILSIMTLPTIALFSESSLRSVPRSYLQGAAALGLPRWSTIRGIVLPAARGGIFTAVLLAAGRAIGETMAVLMVAGNVAQTPRSIFEPVRTLTANIALELGYALDHHRSALFVSGLMLMSMIIVLVAVAARAGEERSYD